MIVKVNGVHYNVNVVGKGEPLLFLHGFTGSLHNWDEIVDFMKNTFQCILLDIIGHGKTESPTDFQRYDIEMVAKDIDHILGALGLSKVNLLGYSMGGRLALAFSLNFQERVKKLILESSSPGLRTEDERNARRISDEKLANQIEQNGIESFVHYWENIPLFSSQNQLPVDKQLAIRVQRLSNNPLGIANSLRGMGTGSQPSYWDRLGELSAPILLLCGELDSKFCTLAELMSKCFQNVRVEKINDAGHAIHVEQPIIFGKIVSEFVFDQNDVDQSTY
ncbi:2-succinyl-6-hydroxy-2,4-cyclohexadiene-1-carboxylate synthase [Fredinandcohnia humi]